MSFENLTIAPRRTRPPKAFPGRFRAESTIPSGCFRIQREDFADETVLCCRFGSLPIALHTKQAYRKAIAINDLKQTSEVRPVLAQQLRMKLNQFDNKRATACINA